MKTEEKYYFKWLFKSLIKDETEKVSSELILCN